MNSFNNRWTGTSDETKQLRTDVKPRLPPTYKQSHEHTTLPLCACCGVKINEKKEEANNTQW